jgi:CheY-like chemotaxis protein
VLDEQRLFQKLAPRLQKVLVVDPTPASVKLLTELLRAITGGAGQVWSAHNEAKAMQMVQIVDPQLIFLEHAGPGLDGARLTRLIRRSDLACREVPVIMVTGEATAATIMGARDAGVHEFLRKPYTMKDLLRRLEAVALKPRDWVEAVQYVGPDRRRFNSAEYTGPRKRKSDVDTTSDAARMLQALKIVRAAAGSLKTDWAQARRALLAQAAMLHKVGQSSGNAGLAAAAAAMARELPAEGQPNWRALEAAIVAILQYMPKDPAASRAA